MKKLGGTLFIRNGLQYDYCFVEAIKSLQEFCHEVIIIDAGSTDNSQSLLKPLEDSKTKIIYLDGSEWEREQGREKLAYFQNKAIDNLTTEWNFCLQADEIVHEKSYDSIHRAINSGLGESYMCSRINLWGSPYYKLNVEHARMPCSKEIIRLAKTQYRSWGDGESIDAQCVMNFVNDIEIWHYGFVRKKEVMKSKIINMQCAVFGMENYDQKLNECEVFNSKLWFDGDDLAIIDSPHPKIIKEWILTRP